jgi:uncharacterized protein (DUF305 family)
MPIPMPAIRTAAALAFLLAASCAPAAPPPAVPVPEPRPAEARPRANEGDVRFMQDMIGHHAQALAMTELVPGRAARADLHLMAERIEVSQRDEIALMRRWLRAHGADTAAVDGHAHHAHGPGMLSPEEMARLAGAAGSEFDRLFLELMIRHHEGAVQMVRDLFATPGAGQDSDVYQIAAEVEADQLAEIARMRRMLQDPPPGAAPR